MVKRGLKSGVEHWRHARRLGRYMLRRRASRADRPLRAIDSLIEPLPDQQFKQTIFSICAHRTEAFGLKILRLGSTIFSTGTLIVPQRSASRISSQSSYPEI